MGGPSDAACSKIPPPLTPPRKGEGDGLRRFNRDCHVRKGGGESFAVRLTSIIASIIDHHAPGLESARKDERAVLGEHGGQVLRRSEPGVCNALNSLEQPSVGAGTR